MSLNLPVPFSRSVVPAPEVLIGELVSDGVIHDLCGEYHYFADGDLIMCCSCGHAHLPEGSCLADGPCGNYLCCIN